MNLIHIQTIKPWIKLLIALLYTLTVVNTQHCEGISKSVEQDILTNESYMVYTFLHTNILLQQKEYGVHVQTCSSVYFSPTTNTTIDLLVVAGGVLVDQLMAMGVVEVTVLVKFLLKQNCQ